MLSSRIILLPALLFFANIAYAQNIGIKKDGFMGYFSIMCMHHLANLEGLRAKINDSNAPKLPAESAKLFLNKYTGDVWPLPEDGRLGNLVMVLPYNKNICIVNARRINKNEVEKQFEQLVSKPLKPLVATLKSNEERDTVVNGKTHTISYIWDILGASRKLLFMLTTSDFEKAELQGLATASIIKDE